VAFVSFVVSDVDRVWTSPLRGTSTWTSATVAGLGAAAVATGGWLWSAWRPDGGRRSLGPWQYATGIALIVAFLSTHARDSSQPPMTTGYMIGAVWFELASMAGIIVVAAAHWWRPRSRVPRVSAPPEPVWISHGHKRVKIRR
jgi:hypothetical protein